MSEASTLVRSVHVRLQRADQFHAYYCSSTLHTLNPGYLRCVSVRGYRLVAPHQLTRVWRQLGAGGGPKCGAGAFLFFPVLPALPALVESRVGRISPPSSNIDVDVDRLAAGSCTVCIPVLCLPSDRSINRAARPSARCPATSSQLKAMSMSIQSQCHLDPSKLDTNAAALELTNTQK